MYRNPLSRDIVENAIVRSGFAARVMFGSQTVDRNRHGQAIHLRPRRGQRPERTRNELHVNTALDQLRNDALHLAIPHQRIAPDERQMQRLRAIDDLQNAVDQIVALEIAKLTKCGCSAEMIILVRVTSWTSEGALSSYFDRKGRSAARKNGPPRAENMTDSHYF
jgi:hypothetical protein